MSKLMKFKVRSQPLTERVASWWSTSWIRRPFTRLLYPYTPRGDNVASIGETEEQSSSFLFDIKASKLPEEPPLGGPYK